MEGEPWGQPGGRTLHDREAFECNHFFHPCCTENTEQPLGNRNVPPPVFQPHILEHLSVVAAEYERLCLENHRLQAALQQRSDQSPDANWDEGGAIGGDFLADLCPGRLFHHAGAHSMEKPSTTASTTASDADGLRDASDGIDLLQTSDKASGNATSREAPMPHASPKTVGRRPSRDKWENADKTIEADAADAHNDEIEFISHEIEEVPVVAKALGNLLDMKAKLRKDMIENATYDVKNYYKKKGMSQAIARSPIFEQITMAVIAFYAMWIAIDTDRNHAPVITQAHPVFFIAEQVFCLYFFVELMIRWCAFEVKCNAFKDAWFVFDSILVSTMVLETWIMTAVLFASGSDAGYFTYGWDETQPSEDEGGSATSMLGNASILRMARLMRLTRLFRMARLLKMMPELLIMVKAIAAAMRSVLFTMLLLGIMLYVGAIAFTQELRDTEVGEAHFSRVGRSMHSLVMYGTFLDAVSDIMAELLDQSPQAFVMMYIFILFSAITIMNMLIGVMCEVITAVAAAEKEAIQVTCVKERLSKVMTIVNEDGEDMVYEDQFAVMRQDKGAMAALKDVGVQAKTVDDFAEIIFEEAEPGDKDRGRKMLFAQFIDQILELRGSNSATVKDVEKLRKWMSTHFEKLPVQRATSKGRGTLISSTHLRGSMASRRSQDHHPTHNEIKSTGVLPHEDAAKCRPRSADTAGSAEQRSLPGQCNVATKKDRSASAETSNSAGSNGSSKMVAWNR